MRQTARALAACLAIALVPSSASAWGFAAHKYIMRRAIDLLPPELKPFYVRYREEIVVRVVDPDLWRNVGWPEEPNHFVDFGVREYGPYPFTALPRDYGAALGKFGRVTLERNGLLPWREEEMFGNLRRAFEGMGRDAPYAVSDVVVFSAVAAHYMQDAYQPLHATDNFDGARTGQQGIHARFERDLFERDESRLSISPGTVTPFSSARDAAFEVLLESFRLVDPLLAADRKAIAGRDAYDDAYFAAFFTSVEPLLEQRIGGAIAATASLIVGAWQLAGKPVLKLEISRPVERVRPGPR
jgi:hypothetical protein